MSDPADDIANEERNLKPRGDCKGINSRLSQLSCVFFLSARCHACTFDGSGLTPACWIAWTAKWLIKCTNGCFRLKERITATPRDFLVGGKTTMTKGSGRKTRYTVNEYVLVSR